MLFDKHLNTLHHSLVYEYCWPGGFTIYLIFSVHSSALKRMCNFKMRWRKFKRKYICFFVRFIFMHKFSFCFVCWDDIFVKNLSVSFLFIYFDGNQLWRIDVFSYSVFTTILTYFRNLLSVEKHFFGSGRVRVGLGLKFIKMLWVDFGPAYKTFYNIKSNNYVLSLARLIFLQRILLPKTAAFFCSLLELVSHFFWEGDSGEEISSRWWCVEKINHSSDVYVV